MGRGTCAGGVWGLGGGWRWEIGGGGGGEVCVLMELRKSVKEKWEGERAKNNRVKRKKKFCY